ncbi:tyrosine-type recombinase/integrase [Natronorubrum sp. FCH18a]|uniref:tyrosine-type recombinase/integrase n=1 Tax=Natronorubrum sp. FCH18a TaxID=3447018 RepID=UPI003F50F22B
MTDDWYSKVFENKHDVVNDFLERKADIGRSDRTLNTYSRTLQKFFHEHFPELHPEEVEVLHIEKYLHILNNRDLKQNTKRRYLESLSAFFSWAMKRPRYNITGNPAGVLLEELPKQINDRPDCATWENAKKIVQATDDPRDKLVTAILAKTGCRVDEALSIKYDDLLLEDGFIRLRVRKGGKQTVVPIDEELEQAIERYQFVSSRDDEYLSPSIYGNKLGKERMRRSVRSAAVKADVMEEGETRFQKKFTPHTFRTVFTTLMRNQGMKDHFLQYIRGDAEQETMDIYTRVDRDEARTEYLKYIKPLDLMIIS